MVFEFPVVKLDDWRGCTAELMASDEPFALVVLAHLKVRAVKNNVQRKYAVKRELILLAYERGYSNQYTQSLLRFLDWLIRLPEPAEQKLKREVDVARGEKRMSYITSWERMGEKRGERKVILQILQHKLGSLDEKLSRQIEKLSAKRLEQLAEALLDFSQSADLERWLKRKAG